MSIQSPKPGIPKPTTHAFNNGKLITKSGGDNIRSNTSSALQNSTRSSLFSTSCTFSNGIGAQRTINPAKLKPDYSNIRMGFNGVNGSRSQAIAFAQQQPMQFNPGMGGGMGMGGANKFQAAMMAMGALQELGGVIAGFKSESADKTPKTDETTIKSSPQGAAGTSISGMENAKDSLSLRGAIADAGDTKSSIQSSIGELKGEGDNSIKKAEADVKSSQAKFDGIEKQYNEINGQVTEKKNSVISCKADESSKLSTLNSAKENVTTLSGALDTAQAAYDDALKTGDQTAITKTGSGLAKAKADLKLGKEAEAQAELAYNKATQLREKTEGELTALQDKLEKAEEGKKSVKEQFEEAKKDLELVKKDVAEKKNKLEKCEKEIKDIDNSVSKHQDRLKKLVNDEDKELKNIPNEMIKLARQNGRKEDRTKADGKSSNIEGRRTGKVDANLAESSRLEQRQKDLMRNKEITKLANSSKSGNGFSYNKGFAGGKEVFLINGKEVNQTVYNERLTAAGIKLDEA